jgi:protease IV
LTGSIGVLAGKFVLSDLLQKVGMSVDSAQIGANAAMYSSASEFSARAHSRLEAFLDDTYKGFKDHVASGRRMTQEEVEDVAKGRVWSGEDAKARGLVDELGGRAVALRLAKEAARLAPDAAVKLTVFPREKETFEIVFDRLFGKDHDGDLDSASSGSIEHSLRAIQPLLQHLQTLLDNSAALTMPVIGPVR